MHCVYLADIAAVLSEHGPSIIYRNEPVPAAAMTHYWVTSRKRFDLWHQAMARYRMAESTGDHQRLRAWWGDHFVVLEEVLVSQILTRVISAIAAELDEKHSDDELAPVTHAIFLSHMEATNRVQQLMLRGRGISVPEAVKLNRLRRGVERWTDSLLGRMYIQAPNEIRYAIDPVRAQTYAKESRDYGDGKTRRTVAWLMNASMRDMLHRRTSDRPALPQANRAVASSVVQLLRPDLFDNIGVLRSLRLNRVDLDHRQADRSPIEPKNSATDTIASTDHHLGSNDCVFQRWYS